MSTSEHQLALSDNSVLLQAKYAGLAVHVTEETTEPHLQHWLGLSRRTLRPALRSFDGRELVRDTEEGYASQ